MASASPRPAGRSGGPAACDGDALLAVCGVSLRGGAALRAGLHPDLAWARSGSMALTGPEEGPPLLAPAPLASRAHACVAALRGLAGGGTPLDALDGGALLAERAAVFGLRRRGSISPGGSCRLLRAADGWLALNLARPDDAAALAAWLETDDAGDPWQVAARHLPERAVAAWLERGRLLGLPVAPAARPPRQPVPWARIAARGAPGASGADGPAPLVLDLSTLWAGPLCAQLLGLAGARVVKVESSGRPDGARRGPALFFDLLNAGKPSVALDLSTRHGRSTLARLVERADLVVESARPRALRQLGIDAEGWVRAGSGRIWLSITGYGRAEPWAGWVAFGDDAAAAAGLALATGTPERPLFCADAVADPLAGLHAAVAALAARRSGGGVLLDVSLCDAVASVLAEPGHARQGRVVAQGAGYAVVTKRARAAVEPPRARRRSARARPLGADTHAVLRELGISC